MICPLSLLGKFPIRMLSWPFRADGAAVTDCLEAVRRSTVAARAAPSLSADLLHRRAWAGGREVVGAQTILRNDSVVVCDVEILVLVTLGLLLLLWGIKSFPLPAAGAEMRFFFFFVKNISEIPLLLLQFASNILSISERLPKIFDMKLQYFLFFPNPAF